MDPKSFYNNTMPEKQGQDYEHARWHATPLLEAQFAMMMKTLAKVAVPPVTRATSVLEVGPGPGTWTKILLAANPTARYVLLDISREMLDRARNTLAAHQNITYIEEDLASYVPGEKHDFFFSSRALEYMPDKQKVVSVVANALAPGGEGAIITKMPKEFFYKLRGRIVPEFHRGQIAPHALAQYLRASGLEVLGVRIATATVPGIRSAWLNQLVHSVLLSIPLVPLVSVFAESYAIHFRKL